MWHRLLFLLVVALVVIQCDSDPASDRNARQQPVQDSLLRTPMENEEAEIAALVLSRQLIAPEAVYERIKGDLEMIRSTYLDSIPAVAFQFKASWQPGQLGIMAPLAMLTDAAWPGKRQYDSLNELYRFDSIRHSYQDWHTLQFAGRFNPAFLVKDYAQVPGLLQTHMTGSVVGDSPRLYIYPDSTTYRYFFRDAWGDCPAGCITSHFFYFVSDGANISYEGNFVYNNGESTPHPAWVDTALLARRLKEYYVWWTADSGFTWYPDSAGIWFDLPE